jgi:hypothetical protein
LRVFSEADSPLSHQKTFNNYWEWKFTAILRELWIIWWAFFHTMQLRDILNQRDSNKNKKTKNP